MNIYPFDLWVLLPTLLVVVAFVLIPYVRKVATWFVTIIHEVGHGLFSLLTGNGISGIKLHSDGSGLTTTTHMPGLFSRFFRLIVLFAGYSTPIYLGIILLVLNVLSLEQAAFYTLIGVGLLTLIFLRNWFGIVILAIYFLVLGVGAWAFQGAAMPILVNFFAFLFLIKGTMDVVKIAKPVFMRKKYPEVVSDFHILEQESLFHTPAQVWYVMFILWNLVVIAIAAVLVLGFVYAPQVANIAALFTHV